MGNPGTNKIRRYPTHEGGCSFPLPAGALCCSILPHPREGPEGAHVPIALLQSYEKTTYVEFAFFSEKTLRQKSPFLLGSKVEGTMIYSPAGSLNRFSTSRRLMKVFDLSLALLVRKKFLLRWIFVWPENLRETKKEGKNPTVCTQWHSQIKNIIEMTTSSVWKRSPFNRSKREKRREVGASHHSIPELWVQTYFTDHLNKSFGSCLYVADDGQFVKTSGKFFHQLFFF